ncbi:DUF4142 domain-containing protein [Halomonas korlensis]|uniref:DUF4142 domain-containing protein n=1 Tax=Halomonas korlensis TaxID=463301 RepID=A0A1I7J760_9GAMM|nr:DUF4142 domain-containing protein [Halomonas korlensis]SFU81039.1 protein of unknown function [Halomonas korlensis]
MKGKIAPGWLFATAVMIALLALPTQADYDQAEVHATLRTLHQHQAELSALAEERATHDEVIQLAKTLRRDHSLLDDWLAEAANGNARASVEAAPHDREAYEALQEEQGEAFDAAYLAYQERLLRDAIAYLDRQHSDDVEEQSEFANHLRVTHESLRTNLALVESLR